MEARMQSFDQMTLLSFFHLNAYGAVSSQKYAWPEDRGTHLSQVRVADRLRFCVWWWGASVFPPSVHPAFLKVTALTFKRCFNSFLRCLFGTRSEVISYISVSSVFVGFKTTFWSRHAISPSGSAATGLVCVSSRLVVVFPRSLIWLQAAPEAWDQRSWAPSIESDADLDRRVPHSLIRLFSTSVCQPCPSMAHVSIQPASFCSPHHCSRWHRRPAGTAQCVTVR